MSGATKRLYYEDPNLRRFSARVIAGRMMGQRPAVMLDQTAFYPTGGGQPNDTGGLGAARVLDVIAEEGEIWHVLDRLPDDPDVQAEIDWPRRFDHMQQHSGQHLLSEAFVRSRAAHTVAFHLGATASTIDIDQIGLSAPDLSSVESMANAVIDESRPLVVKMVEEADLGAIPLRKPPAVRGAVRIVEIKGFDWSACSGTHVSNTAHIGLIKITGAERRKSETRISFVCGARARADYARLQALVEGLAERLGTGQDQLVGAVGRMAIVAESAHTDLAEMEEEWSRGVAATLWASSEPFGRYRLVRSVAAWPVERARKVAQAIRSRPNSVILLGVRGERPQLLFARGVEVQFDMREVLSAAVAFLGGRGGGQAEWAQGGVATNDLLPAALVAAQEHMEMGKIAL